MQREEDKIQNLFNYKFLIIKCKYTDYTVDAIYIIDQQISKIIISC